MLLVGLRLGFTRHAATLAAFLKNEGVGQGLVYAASIGVDEESANLDAECAQV